VTLFRKVLKKEVPITNIEPWIVKGNKLMVEGRLPYEDFIELYPDGEPSEDELHVVYLRGLSQYEFNVCLYDALAILDDDALTTYVTTTKKLNLDPNSCPGGVKASVYRRFIFELDYILVWTAMKDFHTRQREVNGQMFKMAVTLDDVRKIPGIRKLSIVVYYLSGYIKKIPEKATFFRIDDEGSPDGEPPLHAGHETPPQPS